jgi:predicted RecB family nuclease
MDVAKVAHKSGLPKAKLFGWQAQAAAQLLAAEGISKLKSVTRDVRKKLEEADVEKIGQVAKARLTTLQKQSGVALTKLKKVQKEARDRLEAAEEAWRASLRPERGGASFPRGGFQCPHRGERGC